MDLEELMISLKRGDKNALEPIYLATKKAVYAVVFAVLKNAEATKDIMQDTYLKLLVKIYKYKPKGMPLAWILKIAKNLSLNVYKKNSRFTTLDEAKDLATTPSESSDILDIAALVLSKSELELVSLKAIAGFSHKEISQIKGIAYATVRWQYANAISKLRAHLQKEEIFNKENINL